jgi:hypothetical protein
MINLPPFYTDGGEVEHLSAAVEFVQILDAGGVEARFIRNLAGRCTRVPGRRPAEDFRWDGFLVLLLFSPLHQLHAASETPPKGWKVVK